MGTLYEIASTPAAYATRPALRGDAMFAGGPVRIPFGPGRLQHCVLWQPSTLRHEAPVFWFHGGGFVVGTPESMIDAARVYCSQGYRFVSVGFGLVPGSRFPAQVDDAYAGVGAALAWLAEHDCAAPKVVVGGSSAGGQLACLLGYSGALAASHGFDRRRVAAVVSSAAVVDADDLELRPLPTARAWRACVDLPCDARDRGAIHQALLPFSPVAIVGEKNDGDGAESDSWLPPFFSVEGRHDTLSPYAHQMAFARALDVAAGRPIAHMEVIDDPRWQHMIGTVTIYRHDPRTFPPLVRLFGWLEAFGL